MKAAVHHQYGVPSEVFSIEDVNTPTMEDDEVLLRMRAAGVNWADQSMTLGKPYVMRLGYGFRHPRRGIRGHDIAGTVIATGFDVTDLHVGDEVFGWGVETFAEFATVKADQLIPKPPFLTFEEAAAMPMAGTVALQALRDVARLEPNEEVLIVGASGGIGSFAVQIAKAMEAHVTGVCSTPNLELVRSLGADRVIDYTKEDFTKLPDRYDAILDQADKHSIGERRKVLEPGGTLIPNSGEGGPLLGSLGRIVKARLMSPFVGHRLRPFLSITKREDLLDLIRLVEAGKLTPIVGKAYSLADTGLAIEHAGSGHARGKVVITP